MRAWLQGWAAASDRWSEAALDADERELAGVLTGILYVVGAVSVGTLLAIGELPNGDWPVCAAVLIVSAAWGLYAWRRVDWKTSPPWLTHLSSSAGFVVVAVLMAATGGGSSPIWIYLFFTVFFPAFFYAPQYAVAYFAGCAIVTALPLLYDPAAREGGYVAQLLVVVPVYFTLGGLIVAGKRLLVTLRRRAENLAAEQGARRRVATLAAGGPPPAEIYALASAEIAGLLGAHASGICRIDSVEQFTVMGSWSAPGQDRYTPGTSAPVRPGSNIEQLILTGAPVRVDEHDADSPVDRLGYACSVVAPVRVEGRLWGLLAATSVEPGGLPEDSPERLSDFADLLASAIANAETKEELAARALADPLTGLANHRAVHERLAGEVSRARRHGRALSVAVIDVDHFKHINDSLGHEVGDQVLALIGSQLADHARAEDLLGRIGGDEFAWIMPEIDSMKALSALERARQQIAGSDYDGEVVSISAGICDLRHAEGPDELLRYADGALYWSKAHGRNVCWIYDPEVVEDLSAEERAEHMQRSQALLGLRALARAIDAKDPSTRLHSERVADLAVKLAMSHGWNADRAHALGEAALVHDVGKIGVPDAVLFKEGRLTEEEYEQVKLHAELSAQIVHGVLAPDQVAWIRCHHERPDGRGYPQGLGASEIPEGAALLAVADAWDVMTASRPYSAAKDHDEAIAECRGLVGAQFSAEAVEALLDLGERGLLRTEPVFEIDPA